MKRDIQAVGAFCPAHYNRDEPGQSSRGGWVGVKSQFDEGGGVSSYSVSQLRTCIDCVQVLYALQNI